VTDPESLGSKIVACIDDHFEGRAADLEEVLIAAAAVFGGYLQAVEDPTERGRIGELLANAARSFAERGGCELS